MRFFPAHLPPFSLRKPERKAMDEKTLLLNILEEGLRWTITEWLQSPTEYLYEADTQALLFGKLKQLFREKQQRSCYLHRPYDNGAWREPQPLSLVGCEHRLGECRPDIVIWDPNSQPTNISVIHRRNYWLRLFCCAEGRTSKI
jgi:hypothetical protein